MPISFKDKQPPQDWPWSPGYDDDQFDVAAIHSNRAVRPRRNVDVPIAPQLALSTEDLIAALGLDRHATKPQEIAALSLVIANFMRSKILRDGGWIFYSRDANHYSQPFIRFYYPNHYTRTYILRMIERLDRAGRIEHQVTPSSPFAWFRSRMRPNPEFADLLRRNRRQPRTQRTQLIVLKDKQKRLVPFRGTSDVREWRRDVALQNEALQQFDIKLPTADLSPEMLWQFGLDHPVHRMANEHCYRVYNLDWLHGGRFYGPQWQTLPKRLRPRIVIDGSETCEPDLATCHPRLLCALAGLKLPFGEPGFDFYEMISKHVPSNIARNHIKTAFGIMLCADNERSAVQALTLELRKVRLRVAADLTKQILSAMVGEVPQLQPYFFTGIGLRLQNMDAEICANVQRYCREHDIACLSIHDGFRVPLEHKSLIEELMEHEMKMACDKAMKA